MIAVVQHPLVVRAVQRSAVSSLRPGRLRWCGTARRRAAPGGRVRWERCQCRSGGWGCRRPGASSWLRRRGGGRSGVNRTGVNQGAGAGGELAAGLFQVGCELSGDNAPWAQDSVRGAAPGVVVAVAVGDAATQVPATGTRYVGDGELGRVQGDGALSCRAGTTRRGCRMCGSGCAARCAGVGWCWLRTRAASGAGEGREAAVPVAGRARGPRVHGRGLGKPCR